MTSRKETVPFKKSQTQGSYTYNFNELCRTHGKALGLLTTLKQSKHKRGRSCPPFNFNISGLFGISRVYAEGPSKEIQNPETSSGSAPSVDESMNAKTLNALAQVYISKESGWARVRNIFEKDHHGKNSQELNLISVALVQVFVVTFFGKYIPEAKFARSEFIREHQATVFRTRLEAIRRMKDYIFMKAGAEGGWLAGKVTLFSTSFLFLSQAISSYRNKTSVVEYTIAATITGGLARFTSGLRGIIAGSIVGGAFGSAVGLIAFSFLSAYGLTQQERHLTNVISKLEVERSIVGDAAFHQKVLEAVKEQNQMEKLSAS